MTTILSPNKYDGRRAPIRGIAIHTMEVDETSATVAEAVGRVFSNPARQASAHVGVDTDSDCRYVADEDTAWACPGINNDFLHLELAGRAGQTTGDWADADSKKILERGAQQVATWCRTYGIPARHLPDAQLADEKSRGLAGHVDASRVFKLSTHWDPGPAFPWAAFLARVQSLIGGAVAQPQSAPARAVVTRIRLVVDGFFGPRSRARLQQWAGLRPDSKALTVQDWKAVQRKVGHLVVDGDPGPKTWKAIQKLVGARQDGDPGPKTYHALQTYLNTH